MDDHAAQLRSCMYQYSRAIYRSIKDLIDPYASREEQVEYRRAVLVECERTMTRLADDPHYFARPDRSLFADIRRYFPITAQAQVAWSVREGVGAATSFIVQQVEAGLLDGGVARCHATTRKGKACQRAATIARRISTSSTPQSRPRHRRARSIGRERLGPPRGLNRTRGLRSGAR